MFARNASHWNYQHVNLHKASDEGRFNLSLSEWVNPLNSKWKLRRYYSSAEHITQKTISRKTLVEYKEQSAYYLLSILYLYTDGRMDVVVSLNLLIRVTYEYSRRIVYSAFHSTLVPILTFTNIILVFIISHCWAIAHI